MPPSLTELTARLDDAFGRAETTGEGAVRAAVEAAGLVVELESALAQPASSPQSPEADAGKPSVAKTQTESPAKNAGGQTVRVATATLDRLGSELDELLLSGARQERRAHELASLVRQLEDAVVDFERSATELRQLDLQRPLSIVGAGLQKLRAARQSLLNLAREGRRDGEQLQLIGAMVREDLRDLRIVPASSALESLRRVVRDVAARVRKEVVLQLVGGEVRLDRRVLEAVRDPVLHLVRNAVDHGIEPVEERRARGKPEVGNLTVRVEPRGSRVAISVEDDGGGLSHERIRATAVARGLIDATVASQLSDAEALRLLFRPGFSTAEQVTEVSGRGVGLDVVQQTLASLQGTVAVESTPGRGTRFVLDLPLTLATRTGILVEVGGLRCAIPGDAVERILRVRHDELGTVGGQATVRIGDRQLPFAALGEMIGAPQRRLALEEEEPQPAVILSLGEQRVAVAVDQVLGHQEIVVRPLGRAVSGTPHLAGAAVLDDGGVVAVLNAAELVRGAKPMLRRSLRTERARILVADDALTTRTAMKALLEIAGYDVISAADGVEALRLLRETPCQLVVSDVQMPGLDGLGLTRAIRAEETLMRLPVVLVTSLDSPEDRAAGREAGADGYLIKREVDRGALLDLVRQLLPGGDR